MFLVSTPLLTGCTSGLEALARRGEKSQNQTDAGSESQGRADGLLESGKRPFTGVLSRCLSRCHPNVTILHRGYFMHRRCTLEGWLKTPHLNSKLRLRPHVAPVKLSKFPTMRHLSNDEYHQANTRVVQVLGPVDKCPQPLYVPGQ